MARGRRQRHHREEGKGCGRDGGSRGRGGDIIGGGGVKWDERIRRIVACGCSPISGGMMCYRGSEIGRWSSASHILGSLGMFGTDLELISFPEWKSQ